MPAFTDAEKLRLLASLLEAARQPQPEQSLHDLLDSATDPVLTRFLRRIATRIEDLDGGPA